MGAVNSRAFGLPGVIETAMGYGRPSPIGYDDRASKPTGGMRNLQVVELQPGQTIIRFGQKRLKEPERKQDHQGEWHTYGTTLSHRGLIGGALEGEWWLSKVEYDKVAAYALAEHITVGAAVSALCVVPKDWSDLDVVVTATVMAPLAAYSGLPNPANVNGTHIAAARAHGEEIYQLFIPGLGNGDVLRQALMWGAPKFLMPF